jgi:hypothetical protein
MGYAIFFWPPLQAALSIFNVSLFVKNQLLEKESIKTTGDFHKYRTTTFLKMS